MLKEIKIKIKIVFLGVLSGLKSSAKQKKNVGISVAKFYA